LATARAFAEAGSAVALVDVKDDAVRDVADKFKGAGHQAIGIRCNVAEESEVVAAVERTLSEFGRLDAAFDNAGVQSPAPEIEDVDGAEFDRVNAVDLRGGWT
jgi:NAD(P)-dependent dehydrogenase (short-subunit alcohol dehydrogenase family)